MLIDTHCHIDQYKNPFRLIRGCEKNKILTIGVTNLPSHYLAGKEYVADSYYFKMAIGFHPLAVEQNNYKNELDIFRQHVSQCKYIGEIGLDFSKQSSNMREGQIDVFRQIFHLIGINRKFITIHSRGAEKEVLALLIEKRTCPVVMHWYTGSLAYVDQFISEGHYFSINPAMVQAPKGNTLLTCIPRNRILTETDGPYVKITGKRAEPLDVRIVTHSLTSIWGSVEEDVVQQLQNNFKNLIDL